jgi:DNA-binding NarL/FixJ family response regulator
MTDSDEAVCMASERDLDLKQDRYPPHLPAMGLKGLANDLVTSTMPANANTKLPDVAVIDSHCLTRECIASTISYLFDASRVFLFHSVLDYNNRKNSDFHLIILCLHASDHRPLDLIRSLRPAHGPSIIFLISDLDEVTRPEFIRAAWRLGARGFVSAQTTSMTLALSAIRFVQAGGFFAPVDALLSRPPAPAEPQPSSPAAPELTARERVVLGLLKEGKTNKIIARELRLSSNTVKVHVHNILRKMQASNRTEAASRISPTIAAGDGAVLMLT